MIATGYISLFAATGLGKRDLNTKENDMFLWNWWGDVMQNFYDYRESLIELFETGTEG